jgi:hypothetical protein
MRRTLTSYRLPTLLASLLGILSSMSSSALAQRATWFDINPNTSNDGQNGSSGGRVNHAGAASDLSKVYAATEWGGLYQSFDQGVTWSKIESFIPSATWDVKVDPSNSSRVYATAFFDGRLNPQSGISISNDAGATWTPVNFSRTDTLNCTKPLRKTQPSGWQISINPSVPSTVFVGSSCGLARSTNSGANWTFIDPTPGDPAEQIYVVVAHDRQTVDVIGDNGYLRSTDNGATWSPIIAPPGPVPGNSGPGNGIAVSPQESYVLLAENLQGNIFESDDGGKTWPTSLTLPTLPGGVSDVQGRIPFIKTNQLTTSTQFDVWYGDINIFKTTAITPSTAALGGAARTPQNSWTNEQDNGHWDTGDVMFNPRAAAGSCPMLFTADGGVYRNTKPNNPDCQTPSWIQPNITPHATWIWGFDGVQVRPGQHAITAGLQDDGGWAATNVAEGHNPPPPNWNNYTCCDIFHNAQVAGKILSVEGFCPSCARGFQLFIRDQDGNNSNQIPNYPSAAQLSVFKDGRDIGALGGNGIVINMSDGVYFTNDVLASPIAWTSLNSPFAAVSSSGNVKVANFGNQQNVFYHTGSGNPESRGAIFRSTLAQPKGAPGTNWIPLVLPPNIGSATAYDVDPTNGNHIILSGINSLTNASEIWITQDFGAHWNELNNLETMMANGGGAAPAFVNQSSQGRITGNGGTFNFGTYWQPSLFKFDPLDPSTIAAGAIDAGMYVSLNNGSNWQVITNPLNPSSNSPNITVPIFAYFSPGRFNAQTDAFDIWVGTRGSGVHKAVIEFPPPGK